MKHAHMLILTSLLIGTLFGPMIFSLLSFLLYIIGGIAGLAAIIYLYGETDE